MGSWGGGVRGLRKSGPKDGYKDGYKELVRGRRSRSGQLIMNKVIQLKSFSLPLLCDPYLYSICSCFTVLWIEYPMRSKYIRIQNFWLPLIFLSLSLLILALVKRESLQFFSLWGRNLRKKGSARSLPPKKRGNLSLFSLQFHIPPTSYPHILHASSYVSCWLHSFILCCRPPD